MRTSAFCRCPYRILVADEFPLVRRGLRVLLGSDRDLEVCGEVSNGREVLPLASMKKPDLIIMGLTRIEGLKAIASIRDAHKSEHELTKREIEIVRLLALGDSNKEVAVKLRLQLEPGWQLAVYVCVYY
jgi:DNA-binding NarL/FixJ family response regulator